MFYIINKTTQCKSKYYIGKLIIKKRWERKHVAFISGSWNFWCLGASVRPFGLPEAQLALPHKCHFLVKFWGKQRSVMQGYPGQNNGFFPEAIWRFFWTRMTIISRNIEFYTEAIWRVDIDLWQIRSSLKQSSSPHARIRRSSWGKSEADPQKGFEHPHTQIHSESIWYHFWSRNCSNLCGLV